MGKTADLTDVQKAVTDTLVKEDFVTLSLSCYFKRPGSQETCKGTVVSRSFILTAAHCFHLDEELHTVSVKVGGKVYKAKELHRHSDYNPIGKTDKGVEKSYDYDMALIELDKQLEFSSKIRPICLPCTTGASWALKQRGKSVTCSDHEKTLLSEELVKAMFVAEETDRALERKDVIIKRGSKPIVLFLLITIPFSSTEVRTYCLDAYQKIENNSNQFPDIRDAVTDNFYVQVAFRSSGGSTNLQRSCAHTNPGTGSCRVHRTAQAPGLQGPSDGDSGGPVIVPYKQRFIQVGIISWGTIISCNGPKRNREPVPALSRDFHADIFKLLPWLKEKLKEDLTFLN
ncbi:unnamed protein product [Ranitomeya imitator]|uniref:Peptidase S1 domain-containing protein n=1 Tax=Ranitomeya imitator TaxID=111125 RepID=A0ABN9MB17_9NEOB|nr:unnamed protein product [Ranitomeya imitator]